MPMSTRATLGSCRHTYCSGTFWMTLLFRIFLCVSMELNKVTHSSTATEGGPEVESTRLITALRAVRFISASVALCSSLGYLVPGPMTNVKHLLTEFSQYTSLHASVCSSSEQTLAYREVFLLNTRSLKKLVNLSSPRSTD